MEEKNMIIREENMDLFTVPQGYYLAHCITGDFSLGVGIAKRFDDTYNMKKKLEYLYDCDISNLVGYAFLVDNVFNLVLKRDITKKPKYKKLKKCLLDMKEQMGYRMITKLAIPKLGCGHEGLDWQKVRDIIEEVFEDTDIEILVCSL